MLVKINIGIVFAQRNGSVSILRSRHLMWPDGFGKIDGSRRRETPQGFCDLASRPSLTRHRRVHWMATSPESEIS